MDNSPTVWQLLALTDEQLEQTDLVTLNLAVAQGIPSIANLDVSHCCSVVDQWMEQFRRDLPGMERRFHATPQNWKNDLNFFRVGMLQGFLGHVIGIRYIESQKAAMAVYYTDPSDLFINGIIEKKEGTCGNMAALHVAMARRMGWPVSLACAKSHFISRFDNGHVVHNIEATSTRAGTFCSDPDSEYVKRFELPKRAIECGSDLRRLSAREMLGAFVSLRARHFSDVGEWERADVDYSLSRVLFPRYRNAYIAAMVRTMRRGEQLFELEEVGHPASLITRLAGPKCTAPTFNVSYVDWMNPMRASVAGNVDVPIE